ncbi:hypothetical protein PVAND_013616 [Polypedilum vanderplanki]|uniref:Peptidase S1 domain-containing protein n=1 Tax=Polypedilum vanderplanki TaxID=319348 RepID=A0A9J6CQV3_POLVA|nr:hypothetical protein PVAND_013616 [Polypedilum vanderplanki]
MKKIVLFLCLVSFDSSIGSFNEDYDDMLIQCSMYEKNMPNVRDKHLCEQDYNDDDFLYYITILKTSYSGNEFLCIYFRKIEEETKLRFKIWFSHENFSINAFGIPYVEIEGKKFESFVKFQIAYFVVLPHKDNSIPQVFSFELNARESCSFCGQRIENKAVGLIKGGNVTISHKYPWHATIYHNEMSSLQYKCGASIISENKLITAAHCVTRNEQSLHESTLIVRIEEGELLSSSRYQFKVFRSIVHERYNYETFENDIALLILETRLDILHSINIRAICLPTRGLKFKGEGFVVGFGSTEQHMNAAKNLLETKLPLVKKEVCLDSDPQFFGRHLFDTNFCGGKPNYGVCSGDSGGGFFIQHKGLWVIKGVVSNTKQNHDASVVNPTCSDKNYALFTDVEKYLDWIENRMNN